jgi:ABC-2 type transport system ATP-binding protein
MNYLIEANDISKHYNSQKRGLFALENLSIQIKPGQLYGLLGPDGAGKTTTLRILATTLSPSKGSATIAGFDISKHKEEIRKRIGYMPQNFSLYPDLTVRENMNFFADINGVKSNDRTQRMQEMLDFTRLDAFQGRKAGNLSGGMKKKLALACSLMHAPEILILDEPSTGVDPVSRRELWMILSRVVQSGVSVLVSTPYMDEAERCNEVAVLYEGKLLTQGNPQMLESELPFDVVEFKVQPRKTMYSTVEELPGMINFRPIGDRLRLSVDNAHKAIRLLKWRLTKQRTQPQILRKAKLTMEDVFMNLMVTHQKTVPIPVERR